MGSDASIGCDEIGCEEIGSQEIGVGEGIGCDEIDPGFMVKEWI